LERSRWTSGLLELDVLAAISNRHHHSPSLIALPSVDQILLRQPVHDVRFQDRKRLKRPYWRPDAAERARVRTSAGNRWLLGLPRRLESKLVAPSCLRPRSRRNT
jgi:hypothetical protein